jgi:hypothetical protein
MQILLDRKRRSSAATRLALLVGRDTIIGDELAAHDALCKRQMSIFPAKGPDGLANGLLFRYTDAQNAAPQLA